MLLSPLDLGQRVRKNPLLAWGLPALGRRKAAHWRREQREWNWPRAAAAPGQPRSQASKQRGCWQQVCAPPPRASFPSSKVWLAFTILKVVMRTEFMAGSVAEQALAKGVFVRLLWDRHRNELDTEEEDRTRWETPHSHPVGNCFSLGAGKTPVTVAPYLSRPQELRSQPCPPLLTHRGPCEWLCGHSLYCTWHRWLPRGGAGRGRGEA